jgi:hypothetical protein
MDIEVTLEIPQGLGLCRKVSDGTRDLRLERNLDGTFASTAISR